jgi:hypothetical protein
MSNHYIGKKEDTFRRANHIWEQYLCPHAPDAINIDVC